MCRLCVHTSFHFGVNFEGVVSREDGPVSVEFLTHRQRCVQRAILLIFVISYCDVVQMSVLEMNQTVNLCVIKAD